MGARMTLLTEPADDVFGAHEVSIPDGWERDDIPLTEPPASSLEAFVAGVLSTEPEYADQHPMDRLPLARRILDAISEWEPDV